MSYSDQFLAHLERAYEHFAKVLGLSIEDVLMDFDFAPMARKREVGECARFQKTTLLISWVIGLV